MLSTVSSSNNTAFKKGLFHPSLKIVERSGGLKFGVAESQDSPSPALSMAAPVDSFSPAKPAAREAIPPLADRFGKQVLYPLPPVHDYIKRQWHNLLVTRHEFPDILPDPKVNHAPGSPWLLYIPPDENLLNVIYDLQKSLPANALNGIQVETLPPPKQRDNLPPGLLYLPHPYIVPGGRFKEMYGWDSYFIQLGLLKDNEGALAKAMTENLLYEIEHYGTILNANRSYFINRSQPPFITEMVLNIYNRTGDKQWLQKVLPALEKHYQYWTTGEHLINTGPAAGLSRYYAYGQGPAVEVLQGEIKDGKNHYDRSQEYYRTHTVKDYDTKDYYDADKGQLTPLFYKADQTMRESGFDPSNRFGPLNIDVLNYAPVCLNSLLYRMEKDLSHIHQILGNPDKAAQEDKTADVRKMIINRVLWDDPSGMYLDYNFKTNQRRFYPYATMFFPLWAGIASPEQANRVIRNLPILEAPGGIMTSSNNSGCQWDAPFAWAPLQLVAVRGMQNYSDIPGAQEAAVRIATKFVNQVAKEFQEHGGIFEKYDVNRMESDVSNGIAYGYDTNELGFGWTNGVFLELVDFLKEAGRIPPTAPNIPNAKNSNPFQLPQQNTLQQSA